ncbi:MAG: ribonuclease III [Rhodospirillaceae bacterium]|nr:ribonuclease III [Rhodospirillaceae bacterium]|tara:strand:- start:83 stop:775 length:693 start_codon:yes stop_codon:yes gene_type:complete
MDNFSKLYIKIGYKFKDFNLIKKALTHSSVLNKFESNDKLEFLGDRVLGLIIAKKLYSDFPDAKTGDLAQKFNYLVRSETLVKVAERISLGKFIYISQSEEKNGGRFKSAILADTCEALIAAIYLDGGISNAEKFINTFWEDLILEKELSIKDSKSALQEWSHANLGVTPEYCEISSSGPSHNPNFLVEVILPGFEKYTGNGVTKRKAQQEAAKKLLDHLKKIKYAQIKK